MCQKIENKWSNHEQQGFSMLELMVVLAIVAIIAAMSVSFYGRYTIRANRTDVQKAMVQIGQKLAAYKLTNNDYNTTLSNPAIYGGSAVYPQSGIALYELRLDTTVAGAWTLTAFPKGSTKQVNNGLLRLNDQGFTCWDNPSGDSANLCINGLPTATTTWAGK
ncbi:MAG: prepilin-type N-terminal cleavage/methylation domain-containing protein [Gammaproteobacteria bacterium]|nr:prepilin-type N-terminal cleavage/methylation domain-containing protein [Gammaproteobacteria bacterium]